MATIVLTIVGQAIGGPIGAAIGSAIGAYIDRRWVFPALFGDPRITTEVVGPRLQEFNLLSNSEGAGLSVALGPENRIGGGVVFVSDLIEDVIVEVTRSTQRGGKGGGGSKTTTETTQTTYLYYVNIVIAIADCSVGGRAEKIDVVRADGKLIYKRFSDVGPIVSNDLAAQSKRTYNYVFRQGFWGNDPYYQKELAGNTAYVISDTAGGGPNLKQEEWQEGNDVDITGFNEADNEVSLPFFEAVSQDDRNPRYLVDLDGPDVGTRTFQLRYGGVTSRGILYNETSANLQTILEDDIFGTGNVLVEDPDPEDGVPYDFGAWRITLRGTFGNQPGGKLEIIGQIFYPPSLLRRPMATSDMIRRGSWDGATMLKFPSAYLVPERDGPAVSLFQDNPSLDPTMADGISFHHGSNNQQADAEYAAWSGRGVDTPALRNTAYVAIKRLALVNFGNRVPSTFDATLRGQTIPSVGDAIANIMQRAGRGAYYDVSDVQDVAFRGFNWNGPQAPNKLIEQLLVAHDLNVRETSGKLVFFQRGHERRRSVDAGDLAAHESGSTRPRSFEAQDVSSIDLAAEFEVKFQNARDELQPGSQPYIRTSASTVTRQQVSLSMAFTPGEAQAIARRLLFQPAQDRQSGTFTLPPSYLDVEEGNIVELVDANGESANVDLLEAARGNNGLLKFDGLVRDAALLDFQSDTDDDDDDPPPPYRPPVVQLLILDVPAVLPGAEENTVYLYGAAAVNPRLEWRGATGYRSVDDVDYETEFQIDLEATLGQTVTVLDDHAPPYWDRVSTVEVDLYHGTLTSATETAVLDGENRAVIGQELVGFTTVESLGIVGEDGLERYRLSGFLRGLRNTEWTSASHRIGEPFILLEGGRVGARAFNTERVGRVEYFKAVAAGGDIDDVPGRSHQHLGNSARPFAPSHLSADRSLVDGEVVLSWTRRSRAFTSIWQSTGKPNLEPFEIYVVSIVIDGDLVRQVEVEDTTTWTYTPDDQIADGANDDGFTVQVNQKGETIERGNIASLFVEKTLGPLIPGGAGPIGSDPGGVAGFAATFDNGAFAIEPGTWVDVHVPFGVTITKVKMFAEPAGSIVIDIWKVAQAQFPPSALNSICGGNFPTISSDDQSEDSSLVGWTTSINAHDNLRFYVNSVTDVQTCHIIVEGDRVVV